jgi:hypothetical protein
MGTAKTLFCVQEGTGSGFSRCIHGAEAFCFFERVWGMSSSFFSLRNLRWFAFLDLLGMGGLEGASKAGVVTIDLTGYTGDNGGASVGGFAQINPFGPSGTRLLIFNQYNSSGLYTGLGIGDGSAGIASSGSTFFDTPTVFTAGALIGVGPTYASPFSATVFSNPGRTVGDFGANSFLGFKTSGGQYGYIEATWTASTNTFRMISAAYESTPGVAIMTPGGPAPVPEPASAMIASLFLGGAALKRWRNKRA